MQYDFNLQPNGGQTIEVVGRFVTYKEGLGKIRVKLSKGGFVDLVPGQGVEDVEFTQITINDLSGAANKGSVLAGAFKFRDATITGAVQVIDGGRYRSSSGQSQMVYGLQSALAGSLPHIQIFNPVGSSKNLYVSRVNYFSTGVMPWVIAKVLNVAITTLIANSVRKNCSNVAAGVAEIRGQSSVTQLAVGGVSLFTLDSSLKRYDFTEPIMIPPGCGLVFIGGNVGGDLGVSFEFFEESL